MTVKTVTISFISTTSALRLERSTFATEIVRNWDRSPRQGPSKRYTAKQPDHSGRRPWNRKVCLDGAASIQHAQDRERTLHLHELRRTPDSVTTRHGVLRLEH